MAKAATQQPQQAPLPGAYFDVPGIPGGATQWSQQDDSTTNLVTTGQQAAIVPINGIIQFRQTDVVLDWYAHLNVAQTYTTGTSTLTASAYAPFNVIGAVKLTIQNQYASVDVESGIDWAIFNIIRPYEQNEIVNGVNNYANPAGSPAGGTATGYPALALAQANQIWATQWATSTTAYNLILRLPASQFFDTYYDLAVTGEPVSQPHPAYVSPQYMAGTTRVITPSININPGSSAITDGGPVNISAGTGTYVGSVTTRLRRRFAYAGQPTVQPPVYAWQYKWKTQRFGIGGQSTTTIIIPLETGQLLSAYVRMFDPAANGALGAPININTLTVAQLQYGSGLFSYDFTTVGPSTAAALWQRSWLEKHNTLLPAGVICFDLALDEAGNITNKRALNTLTTAGILIKLSWTGAQSSSSYVVLGTESLVYVT